MKKLLLFFALLSGAVCAHAQTEEVVTETFGNWFKPSTKPSSSEATTNTSATTGITYTSSYTYWNNGGSAILIGYSGSTKGYLSFSLPFDVSKITISSGKQTASGATINVIAGSKTLSSGLVLGKSTDYPIEIPVDSRKAGTVFKIEIPSNISKNAQIAKISYTKAQSGPKELGELSATCNEATVESPLTIDAGTPIIFQADNATSFQVTVNNDEPIILTASNGSAEWIPAICENASVSVVAKREVEGEETQTSEPLTFNLTVKKADFITANWIITSAPSTASGQTVDVDLTLAPESSTGKWHAFAENSYSSGTSGGAQLGSKANPFNGTITLTDSDIPANAIIQEITFNGFTNEAYTLAVTVNEESAGNITVAQTTATDHKLSGFELTGNEVVFSATSASKYLCVKGISIKYTIPEEQPGEILVDYVPQYCLEANDDKTELTVMTGAELRFSSMAAAKMEITTDEEGIELPEAVNEANITWTVPSNIIATIKVTASSESGEKTSERTYTIASEEITPATPKCTFDNESKAVMISTKAGALKIMAAPYTPTPEENTAMMAIEAQGWSFTPGDDPKSYEFSYEGTESTMNVSVKSVTPTKESDVVSFYVSNDGQVSGIENVATDIIAGEAVYYNLQGQRVNADRPGMYIRQQGGKAEKFIIR